MERRRRSCEQCESSIAISISRKRKELKKEKKKAFETCLEGEKVRGKKKKKKISESDEKTKKHKNLLTEFQEFLVRVSYELF